jgi:hypothetical protein
MDERHTVASLRSFIGIPIVLVILSVINKELLALLTLNPRCLQILLQAEIQARERPKPLWI